LLRAKIRKLVSILASNRREFTNLDSAGADGIFTTDTAIVADATSLAGGKMARGFELLSEVGDLLAEFLNKDDVRGFDSDGSSSIGEAGSLAKLLLYKNSAIIVIKVLTTSLGRRIPEVGATIHVNQVLSIEIVFLFEDVIGGDHGKAFSVTENTTNSARALEKLAFFVLALAIAVTETPVPDYQLVGEAVARTLRLVRLISTRRISTGDAFTNGMGKDVVGGLLLFTLWLFRDQKVGLGNHIIEGRNSGAERLWLVVDILTEVRRRRINGLDKLVELQGSVGLHRRSDRRRSISNDMKGNDLGFFHLSWVLTLIVLDTLELGGCVGFDCGLKAHRDPAFKTHENRDLLTQLPKSLGTETRYRRDQESVRDAHKISTVVNIIYQTNKEIHVVEKK